MVQTVEAAMRQVVEEALSGIGQEINRGAIISSTAVSANAKKGRLQQHRVELLESRLRHHNSDARHIHQHQLRPVYPG